jgi:hypothetical protein
MYNTSFVVRYHDIENELIINLHRKFMKKQEEEEREEKIAAARLAASKVAAAVAAIANLEIEKEKEKTPIVPPVKKKGGKKKAISEEITTTTATTTIEEPKKRGRKKAVKVEEEPIKISLTIEPQPEPQSNIKPETVGDNDDNDDNDDNCEDLEYSMEDVHLICEKLYRDELLSVFDVETINDENMDAGIKRVIEKMIDNSGFKQILEEIKQELMDLSNPTGTPEEIENIRRNLEYLIFITLFSQDVFYITHKCICQLFTVNEVHPDLLDRLKEKTIGLFKRN